MNKNLLDKNIKYEYKLELPKIEGSDNKLLLHSCCAPCSGDLMQRLKDSNIDFTIFFYNPNIHPKKRI